MKPKKNLLGWKSQLPLVAVYVAASSTPLFAVDRVWDGSTGTYNNPAAWGGTVPGAADRPIINSGTVLIGSTDIDWTVNGGVSVGGTGSITQSDKILASSGEVWVGQGTGSLGVYNLSGGTLNAGNWLAVGRASGNGTLNITGGTINKTGGGNLVIGSGANALGTVNQSAGTLNSTGSATWLAENSNLPGGTAGDGSAVYNLSGTGVANLALLRLGHSGAGTATFNLDGGVLAVTKIEKQDTATGVINLNGGVLRARANEANFMGGLTSANVKGGGAIIDTNGFSISIAQNLLDADAGSGDTLIKRGAGALTLSGANTFSGVITVEQGALVGRTTGALPGWNTADHIVVKSGGALGGSLGTGGVSQADFETLLSSADMQAGSAVAIDTSIGGLTYATDISALPTGLGASVGFQKTGGNDLTLNNQTFTGDIVVHGGGLIVNELAGTSTQKISVAGNSTATFNNASNKTFGQISGPGNLVFGGNGDKTLTSTNTIGSLVKNGTGTLTLASTGLTTTGNIVTTGGSVNLNGGAVSTTGEIQIGQGALANSTIRVNTGESITANNWLAVGRGGGTGTLEIAGGSVTKQNNGNFMVGARDGGISTGTVNQTGGSLTLLGNNQFWIGQNGNDANGKSTGTYNLSAGTVSVNSWVAIGREGGNGTLNIFGGSFTKLGGDHIEIGGTTGATGLVNQTGGTFDAGTAETRLGLSGVTGSGTYTISGGAANLGQVRLAFANNGTGVVNLDGGTMTASKIDKVSTGGTATFNFNGGVLKAKGSEVAFMQGLTSANVKANGAKIDTNGFDITIGQALVNGGGNGGLTKSGNGKLTLTGASTYTGKTSVTGGTLALGTGGSIVNSSTIDIGTGATFDVSAQTGWTLATGQTVTGSGTLNLGAENSFNVAGGSTLAPGNSPGTLNIVGSISFAAASIFAVEVAPSTLTSDLVNVTGSLTIDPTAVLALTLFGSDSVLAVGTKFVLVDYGTTWNGNAFAGFADNSTTVLGVNSYFVDYDDPTLGNTAFTLTVVPEPTSLLLTGLGVMGLALRRRRSA